MKRKEFALGIILVMAATLAIGCGSKEIENNKSSNTYNTVKSVTPETKNPTVIVMETESPKPEMTKAPIKKEEPVETTKPTEVPKEEKKDLNNIKSMTPILSTIALYMAEGQTYDQNREECYYSIMYMLANNVAPECGASQFKVIDDGISVGEKAMQALSAAAFSDHKMIGKVSKNFSDLMWYEKDKKVYTMYGCDNGDTNGKIESKKENGNGTYTVTFSLIDIDGEALGTYEFTLVENQSKYAAISPGFYYRVKSVKKLTE